NLPSLRSRWDTPQTCPKFLRIAAEKPHPERMQCRHPGLHWVYCISVTGAMAVRGLTGLTSSKRRLASYLIGLSLIVALWTALWALIAWDYRTETRAGFIQTDTLARAVAEHTERVLWEADQLARNVSLAALERGIDMPLRSYVELGLVQSDVFLQLALIDRDGILRASTERDFLPVDLSDREHVRVHRDGRYDGLFVGKPVIGRAS